MFRSINYFALISVLLVFSVVSCVTDDPQSEEVNDLDQTTEDTETNDIAEKEDVVSIPDEDEINEEDVTDDNEPDEEEYVCDFDEVSDEDNEDDSSNLNTGDTSGKQAASGEPGAPCTKDEDCKNWTGADEQYAICLKPAEGYPGGYCSFMCDSSVALNHGCNGYSGVYYGYGTWGDGYCFHPCSNPTDCRVGYRCSKTVGACMPDCAVNECSKGSCDETEKVCLDK